MLSLELVLIGDDIDKKEIEFDEAKLVAFTEVVQEAKSCDVLLDAAHLKRRETSFTTPLMELGEKCSSNYSCKSGACELEEGNAEGNRVCMKLEVSQDEQMCGIFDGVLYECKEGSSCSDGHCTLSSKEKLVEEGDVCVYNESANLDCQVSLGAPLYCGEDNICHETQILNLGDDCESTIYGDKKCLNQVSTTYCASNDDYTVYLCAQRAQIGDECGVRLPCDLTVSKGCGESLTCEALAVKGESCKHLDRFSGCDWNAGLVCNQEDVCVNRGE